MEPYQHKTPKGVPLLMCFEYIFFHCIDWFPITAGWRNNTAKGYLRLLSSGIEAWKNNPFF